MNEYSDYILELYRNPVYKQRLPNPTYTAEATNLSCGDSILLDLELTDDTITAVGWAGDGCAISQAGMSILADKLVGLSIAEAKSLTAAQITNEVGIKLSPRRLRCVLLGLEAVRKL